MIAVAGMFYRHPEIAPATGFARIVVLFTSYKDDEIILSTVQSALAHDYPRDMFHVFVVADSLRPATLDTLRSFGASVVTIDAKMKARSLNKGLEAIPEQDYDLVMVLDADNIMLPGTLGKVNDAFQAGYDAIQCHRTAKNEDTPIALMDGISEEINNHFFRLGQQALGFSAAPSGSGMAFRFSLIRSIFRLPEILDNPGEDREIDLQLLKRGIHMYYLPDAWVLDEKVATHEVFEKQRVRWLEAQWYHLRRLLQPDMKAVQHDRYYTSKLIQNLLLPRSLYIVVFFFILVFMLVERIFHLNLFFPESGWWLSLGLFFILTLVIAMPSRYFSWGTLKAVLALPLLLFSMLKALLRVKSKRREFLHTPKTYKGNGHN